MLTLRVILRANTGRIAVTAAAVAVGALVGIGITYLALIFGGDRLVDF